MSIIATEKKPIQFASTMSDYIFKNELSPLSTIPYHHDVYCIERYFATGFPYHLAIHKIQNLVDSPGQYTFPHNHDFPEMNIFIGDSLHYRVILGDEEFEIKGNYSVWIPPFVMHAANVLSGEGHYIAIRLEEKNINK
jgi:hypothetical protein